MKLGNLTTAAVAACPPICISAYPKVLIASDSTTANYEDGGPLQGWGAYVGRYFNLSFMNLAKNGRSTRSFINDGLWANLLNIVSPGDFVIIEFGHNDDGDPTAKNNTRAFRNTLPGIGDESVELTFTVQANAVGASQGRTPPPPPGTVAANITKKERVHTFGWYLKNMIVDVRDKGGVPIVSGMVPRNYWSSNASDATLQTEYKFRDYARTVAQQLKTEFIDHTDYSIMELAQLGQAGSKKLFPLDNSHTNSKGAILFAETFVRAARCTGSDMADYLNEEGSDIAGGCVGLVQ